MASAEIRLDDEYIKDIGQKLNDYAKELQSGVDSYIKILEDIKSDAIMEGDTAEALKVFIEYAANLKTIIETLGVETKGLCVNFLSEVDNADSYLY